MGDPYYIGTREKIADSRRDCVAMRLRNIVFNCNETILDLTTITPVFQRLFGQCLCPFLAHAMRLDFPRLRA